MHSDFILLFLTLSLGIRHGIDWDHIAALTDITGSAAQGRRAISLGTFYILGHAAVIICLGFAAIAVGLKLPHWIDPVMERMVGATLIILGIWLLFTLFLHPTQFRMRSSKLLLLEGIGNFFRYVHDRFVHDHHNKKMVYKGDINKKTAFVIGMIHGIGAETPTQILLFVTAAGAGKGFFGVALLTIFVVGLMISNFIINLLSTLGFAKVKRHIKLQFAIGVTSGVFSLFTGALFLLGKGSILPVLFGG